jgi:hypothetical protein
MSAFAIAARALAGVLLCSALRPRAMSRRLSRALRIAITAPRPSRLASPKTTPRAAADSSKKGELYLRKPGRMRWQYTLARGQAVRVGWKVRVYAQSRGKARREDDS